jgi:hypothetical protein
MFLIDHGGCSAGPETASGPEERSPADAAYFLAK